VANVVNLEQYIENNRERIKCTEYKAKGYYVGSGMIESGHKIVIQKRMKQAGMRWGMKGAHRSKPIRT